MITIQLVRAARISFRASRNTFPSRGIRCQATRTISNMANMETRIPELKLNDGTAIPMLGYGTGTSWYKSGDEDKIDRKLVDCIKQAIAMGYKHLDGAEVYKTEPELGLAIQESGVARKELYVVTKVLPRIDDIEAAIDISLKKLRVEYVDLYLIHSPFFAKKDEDLQKAWAAMEAVKASGKAKSIGVSNWLPQHFKAIEGTQKIVPSINQIEFHTYLQHPELLKYHVQHGIATSAYSPLTPITKAAPGPIDDFLSALVKKYAVNAGEILLRQCIDQDVVAITTSSKEQRMSDMLRVSKFKLTPKEISTLNELGEKKHYRAYWTDRFDANDRS